MYELVRVWRDAYDGALQVVRVEIVEQTPCRNSLVKFGVLMSNEQFGKREDSTRVRLG